MNSGEFTNLLRQHQRLYDDEFVLVVGARLLARRKEVPPAYMPAVEMVGLMVGEAALGRIADADVEAVVTLTCELPRHRAWELEGRRMDLRHAFISLLGLTVKV